MNEAKVKLEPHKEQGWVGAPLFRWTAIRSAVPFWRARKGWKIHRVRTAMVFFNDRGRICLTWWCGNSANNPIPFKPECADGLSWCDACERRFRAHQ